MLRTMPPPDRKRSLPESPEHRLERLIRQADPLVVSDVHRAAELLAEALALARETGDRGAYARALCLQAATLVFQSRYGEARTAFEEARRLSQEERDPVTEARALNGLGITARNHGDYAAAMEHFLASLHLVQERGDEVGRLRVLVNIGLMHTELGDFQSALSTQLEVIAQARELGETITESSATVNAAVASSHLRDYPAALDLIARHLPVVQQRGIRQHEVLLHIHRALCLLALGQLPEALEVASHALPLARQVGDHDSLSQLLVTLARTRMRLDLPTAGETEEALREALALSEGAGLRVREAEALHALSDLEAARGHWEAAYRLARRYHDLDRALRGEALQRKTEVLSAQMQLEILRREAELSRVRNAELERHVERRTLELRRANERLLYDAFHDALTGLGNRALFYRHLQGVIRQHLQGDPPGYAVLFLDCDRFKAINDTLGHDVGDQFLRAFAQHLVRGVRGPALVCRFGGDEFAVLLGELEDPAGALDAAEALRQSLSTPLDVGGRTFLVTAGIGVVVGGPEYLKPEDVLRDADIAMYHAKARGPGGIALFEGHMYEHVLTRARIEAGLRESLREGSLSVHYQPIVDVRTGTVQGLEALARWVHPDLGALPPGEFIPVAEDVGLIAELDRLVMKKACLKLAQWSRQTPEAARLHLGVNISTANFEHPDFARVVQGILTESGLEAGRLHAEITESLLLDRSPCVQDNLEALHQLGVHLSIDDFGTGYSSLGYLQAFHASTLKIDRSFIRDLTSAPRSAEMVRTIIALARNLNMRVIAEGVSNREQWDWLAGEGCDLAQGYYFSPPLPEAQVPPILAANF